VSAAKSTGGSTAFFNRVATAVAEITGRPSTFLLCCVVVLVWAATGPLAHYSDTWQLIINTGTTIVTFLMVFLIQNTQNRDSAANQTKLDELIRALEPAQNKFIGIEKLSEEEIEALRDECESVAQKYDEKAKAHRAHAKALADAQKQRKPRA
jgi:low affinity Fe/Cu permease